MDPRTSSLPLLERLQDAANSHDLDALADCFTDDYVNETPAHPARDFTGRGQVRANWTQLFAGVPDLRAVVLRSAAAAGTLWSEWEMSGTRRDGSRHLMRGVIIFGVTSGRASWARFYLEPVQDGGGDVDAAVRAQVRAAP
jgi:ketosteroid isomerase-like protein